MLGISVLLGAGLLLADHQARFFQGDSLFYLMTEWRRLPPDRSWAFGLAVSLLFQATRSLTAFIVFQAGLLSVVVVLCRAFFPLRMPWRVPAFGAFLVLAGIDPMLGLYTRFTMSDLLAGLFFVTFLVVLARALQASRAGFLLWLPALTVLATAAVFTRVAYAAILGTTIVLAAIGAARRHRGSLGRLATALGVPVVAAGLLVMANASVFSGQFPGEWFLNKSSGVFLMGTFAPALSADDFRTAGVPVSDAEIATLDLRNYDKRGAQIWSADDQSAHMLVKRHLGVTGDYSAKVDAVCSRIFWHAVRRDPAAVATVYATTLAMYFQPAQWGRFLDHELGLTRPLPPDFVEWVQAVSGVPILPGVTATRSLVLDAFQWFAPAYAILLLVWFGIAVYGLAAGRAEMPVILVNAGLVAVLVTVPLYAVYVIPRYVIAAVLLGHVLSAQTAAAVARRETAAAIGRAIAALRTAVSGPLLSAAAAFACIAVYAGLLVLGRWQADEYMLLASQHEGGPGALFPRLLYSPRLVSEGLLFLYARAVLAAGSPLIVPSLAAVWAGTLLGCVLAARWVLPPQPGRWLAAAALGATPFAFVLTTEPVTEVFYWPMSAAAYLPTLGAVTALLLLVSRAGRPAGAALLIAACSTEIGAAFAIGFAVAASILMVWERHRDWPASARAASWWVVPGLAGGLALGMILFVRAHVVELDASHQPLTGDALRAGGLALWTVLTDLTAGDGLGRRLLFAAGFVLVWRRADPLGSVPGRWQAVLAVALAGASVFSVAAAYFHYGELCCERHATTRHWMLTLLVIQGAAFVATRLPALRPPQWLASAVLAASLVPGPGVWTGLRQSYTIAHFGTVARVRTWQSAAVPGPAMQFFLPPDSEGLLVRGTGHPPGTYRTADAPALLAEAGRLFGKSLIVVCQPWQAERDVVFGNMVIPACPQAGMTTPP